MTVLKKTLVSGLAALTVAAGLAGASAPAMAWGHHGGWGGPAAAGLIGGLAAGAIIGSAASHPYYPPAYAYGPEPVYDACYLARRPVYDAYGYFAGYRHVRVCN